MNERKVNKWLISFTYILCISVYSDRLNDILCMRGGGGNRRRFNSHATHYIITKPPTYFAIPPDQQRDGIYWDGKFAFWYMSTNRDTWALKHQKSLHCPKVNWGEYNIPILRSSSSWIHLYLNMFSGYSQGKCSVLRAREKWFCVPQHCPNVLFVKIRICTNILKILVCFSLGGTCG